MLNDAPNRGGNFNPEMITDIHREFRICVLRFRRTKINITRSYCSNGVNFLDKNQRAESFDLVR